jgi:pyruvate/2-oxoglutarate dehydrogenase complex dihydrolipoamide acyltransferase (E2) component
MRVTIPMPELGSPRVRFSGWFVRLGDEVREGERIAEVLIPGVAVDVLAPAAGVLAKRCVRTGRDLNADAILGEIETASE